ncbi:MAG: hypothetical protein FJ100_15525 [Deltaproteobacteria bacterium]|nr:hypothetical protein [Deltaproteobacteria bacterium]
MPTHPSLPRSLAAGLFLVVAWTACATDAHAIPAFARRYETSCTTCHTAFPRLTPFGEAFRRNAYRFPGGGDATSEKQEPLMLGNEAQKDRYPVAVWPGALPGIVPLSVVADGKVVVGPHPETHGVAPGGHSHASAASGGHGSQSSPDLAGLGGHLMLRTGGTFGDRAAFFGGIDFGGHDGTAVERAALVLTPWDATALQVRVGRFEPALHGVSIHRGLLSHQLRLTTTAGGISAFAPEPSLNGVELSGVALGRLGWAVGAVESASGNISWQKDAYARIEGKLGGMRLDGLHAEATGNAWSERSLSLGASAYRGRTHIESAGRMLHQDNFWRAGLDVHAVFDDFQFDAVAARQSHTQPTAKAAVAGELDLAFAELAWVPAASFIPLLRAEYSRFSAGGTSSTRWVASAALAWVVRPNVVARLQGDVGADADERAGFRNASAGFSIAF